MNPDRSPLKSEIGNQRRAAVREESMHHSSNVGPCRAPDSVKQALEALRDHRLNEVQSFLQGLLDAERGPQNRPKFRNWIFDTFSATLRHHGIGSGVIAEIGGSMNSFLNQMPSYERRFLSLYAKDDPNYIQADITDCPQIPDETFDAILSINVLEHVTRPWLAAKEIARLLKPGGITFHVAPFSFFYHEAPIDCWRYTPEAFKVIFDCLETLRAEFYTANRRRDNRGSGKRTIEYFNPAFAIDAFGGWRENIYTVYAGKRPNL